MSESTEPTPTEPIIWKRDESGCVRRDEHGNWWSLNQQHKGWNSFGFRYPSQEVLEKAEHSRVLLDEPQTDKYGTFYRTEKNMSSGYWAG